MDRETAFEEIKKLSLSDRISLVGEIWESIFAEQEKLDVTDEQRKKLDRRLESYYSSPDDGISWEEIKERIKPKK